MIGRLVLAAIVMILNETISSVALRNLTVELDVTATTVQWLTSGFLLTMAVVIPTTGFLLERFTPRQVFLASMTLFNLGTLLAALAPGFALLLVGRVVQACGTALMLPLLMTSVMRLIPAAPRRDDGHHHHCHRRRPRDRADGRRRCAGFTRLALDVLARATPRRGRIDRRGDPAAAGQ
jgi:MFS family permease